ncbi:hypothetical protein XELAEV_18013905mg [Xenopus laevis]|uniref:Uncharacterized protein n=1 Tax=Xenopus laevis TaxID=8355 RepID=A0A974HZV8_XENLA|nr:hypothetical protein XELAEV_18013905mg [Xenopus laevis]
MATADLRDELSCSICLILYTDPVTLPCGHNFCQGCIGRTWDTQKGSGAYSCPECREEYKERPALPRNRTLGNIAERFRPTETQLGESEIFCTYCVLSPEPATKSCLLCEASLCDTHLRGHSQSQKHILTAPTSSFGERKCPQHDELLNYYCHEETICVCLYCSGFGDHKDHNVEPIKEAFEKKKNQLIKVLQKLPKKREETERRKEKLSLPFTDLIHQLEIKKEKQGKKMQHIEELCSMADPFSLLKKLESEEADIWEADCRDIGGRESDDGMLHDANDLDEVLITGTLYRGLGDIATRIKTELGNESIIMDTNTAHRDLTISIDAKTVSYSKLKEKSICFITLQTFQTCTQVLSTRSFHSWRRYWDVDCSKAGNLRVGVAYPSIERRGDNSLIGNNNKSWVLVTHRRTIRNFRYEYSIAMAHDTKETNLSCPDRSGPIKQIRVFLDYEAGRLSFYELSEPIRHLHTFIAKFTEPLHAAFWVGDGSVTIAELIRG